jgi:hypothetical protein
MRLDNVQGISFDLNFCTGLSFQGKRNDRHPVYGIEYQYTVKPWKVAGKRRRRRRSISQAARGEKLFHLLN